jgi:hypothetical protein
MKLFYGTPSLFFDLYDVNSEYLGYTCVYPGSANFSNMVSEHSHGESDDPEPYDSAAKARTRRIHIIDQSVGHRSLHFKKKKCLIKKLPSHVVGDAETEDEVEVFMEKIHNHIVFGSICLIKKLPSHVVGDAETRMK